MPRMMRARRFPSLHPSVVCVIAAAVTATSALPAQPSPARSATSTGDDDGPITIEQLLSHRSGLQRVAGNHWRSYEFPTEADLRRLYSERPAAFAPSVRWKYSNLAYAVAGLLIEAVSGEKWADYVDHHIYQPLGMTSSSVDKNVPGLAVPQMFSQARATRRQLQRLSGSE